MTNLQAFLYGLAVGSIIGAIITWSVLRAIIKDYRRRLQVMVVESVAKSYDRKPNSRVFWNG